MSKDFTKEWKETFTRDFEGKYLQVGLGVKNRSIIYLFFYDLLSFSYKQVRM